MFNNARQNFISSLTKSRGNTPMDVFGSIQKNSGTFNLGGNTQAWQPKPYEPKQRTAPATPKPMSLAPKPQYPFGGASMQPQQGPKQNFMQSLMGGFGLKDNKVANSLETHPATSWIYGKQPQQQAQMNQQQGGGLSLENPFKTNVAEASDGGVQNAPTGGQGYDQNNAFGGGAQTAPTGQNGASTAPQAPAPSSAGQDYVDFLRQYQAGERNIDNKVIPLEDITGQQANLRRTYGDELEAKAALAGLEGKSDTDKDKVLSVSEAKDLGVPYGTTQSQAAAMGKIPGATTGGGADIAKEGLAVVQELLNNTAGFGRAVGLGDVIPTLPGSAGTDFKNNVSRLKALLTLDNLKLLKGAMSDKDLAFLLSVGTSLNTNMSKEAFTRELATIQQKLQTAQLGGTQSAGGTSAGGGEVGLGLF